MLPSTHFGPLFHAIANWTELDGLQWAKVVRRNESRCYCFPSALQFVVGRLLATLRDANKWERQNKNTFQSPDSLSTHPRRTPRRARFSRSQKGDATS